MFKSFLFHPPKIKPTVSQWLEPLNIQDLIEELKQNKIQHNTFEYIHHHSKYILAHLLFRNYF